MKDINKLSNENKEKLNKLGLNLTFAEVSFSLPCFIEDEKGNVYRFRMAQAISWTQDNKESFLPCYKLVKGKERRYRAGYNGGYLNAPQNWPGHWISDTEYNAKASLLCWLIERQYMTVDDIKIRLENGREKKDFMTSEGR